MIGACDLLAKCHNHGIRLLPVGIDGLTIDAPQGALSPELLEQLKAQKRELLTLLRPVAPVHALAVAPAPRIARKPLCKCGSTTVRDVPIHGGHSIRRDCSRCGQFIDFPLWHGKDALHNEQ